MKLKLRCFKCQSENPVAFHYNQDISEMPLEDSGIYEFTCKNAHENLVLVQNHKYELLYDAGVISIYKESYMDAIFYFSASLEKFYGFFINTLLFSKEKYKTGASPEAAKVFEYCWKNVARQSERQLGAYIFLYLDRFEDFPPMMPDKMVKLRNDIVHYGKFPTASEAKEYGTAVLNFIRSAKQMLSTEELEFIYNKEQENKILAGFEKTKLKEPGYLNSTNCIPTILSNKANNEKTFEQICEDFIDEKSYAYYAYVF